MGILSTIGKVAAAVITVARFIPGPWTAITNVLGKTVSSALFAMSASSTLATVQRKFFGPKISPAQASRLTPSMDASAFRKMVFGETALNNDLRYWEPGGTEQEYVDYIIATSAHQIESHDQLWFESNLVWTASGGVVSEYVPYLTVTPRAVGTTANYVPINGGSKWGSTTTLTGCSYIHIRLKRTGADKKAESPVANGLPSRVTIKGKGALLYDPRLDSTVVGGSGSMRATDQTTWGTANATNRDNTALQLLWYLLGWKINGKLSVGCGIPPARIDLASFIGAANACDQAIALAGGGTQARYATAGVCSDADDRMDVIQNFLTSLNGTLRDNSGRLSLKCMTNDLASPVLSFSDDDVLGDFTWEQTRGLDEAINVLHGRYSDPSNDSLFQLIEYPSVTLTSVDGIERMQMLDLPWVQDGRRAQRIAKQSLQRAQYRGIFTANFSLKALGCAIGDPVLVTFSPLGWANKPFRVVSQGISASGVVPLTLIEENAAIYAWDRNEQPVVTATAPTIYDPLNSPYILGIDQSGTTANWTGVVDDAGTKPQNNATVGAPAGTPVGSMTATDISSRVSTAIDSAGLVISGKTLADRISGTLTDAQIASLAASKVTGQLTNAQLAGIEAAKIAGTLTNAQIASLAATKITGQLTDTQLAAIAAAKITGQITSTQITDNSISTAKIAAGAVTASEIAAGSITTAKIAANAITATKIAANAVTTEKLTISSGNLVANSNFASGDLTDWRPWAAPDKIFIAAPSAAPSKYVAQFAWTGTATTISMFSGASAYSDANASQSGSAVVAGQQYFVTIDMTQSSDYSGGGIGIYAFFQKADGTYDSSTFIFSVAPTTSWSTYSGSFTAIAGALRVWLYVYDYNHSAGSLFFTNLWMWQKNGGELIVDGAISASKLAAGSVVAGKIAADSVTANEIAANAITASEISAGSITTAKIAAGAVTAGEIAAGSITTDKLDALAVTADKIAAGSITALKLATGELITSSAQIATGIITNAKIGNLEVDSAKIANLTVGTGKISNNAVSELVYAYTVGGSTLTSSTLVQFQTVTFSANGGDLLIQGAFSSAGSTGLRPNFVIRKNGNLLSNFIYLSGQDVSFTMIDQPTAGTHTYTLWVAGAAGASIVIGNAFLSVLELKK